jgi:hypothetical protein
MSHRLLWHGARSLFAACMCAEKPRGKHRSGRNVAENSVVPRPPSTGMTENLARVMRIR